MIVKNEAHVIRRCLESVRPFIDTWVIVDTGSTDGTQDIIRDYFKDIPGELFERPWKDFGHNRTEALSLGRSRADYLFIIDADDELVISSDFRKPELTADAYSMLIFDNSTQYWRPFFVSTRLDWRYVGVLHEYLDPDTSYSQGRIADAKVRRRIEGGRSKGLSDAEKYLNDARILEKALADEPDNSRYVFYLAQSYRDADVLQKSMKAYQRRATMGGWAEEVWYSLFEVAKLSERLKLDASLVIQRYLDAYEARPQRAEPLVQLARFYREQKKYALAHLFSSKAKTISRPDDTLFIDVATYEWRAFDEYAVASYWVGNYRECADTCETLLKNSAVPMNQLARITENLNFALKKMGKRL